MREFSGFQKGVNLGGWISQFSKYDENHFETFITEKDIEFISSLGFDHVRVPVDYIVLTDDEGTIKESGFGYLENCRMNHHLACLSSQTARTSRSLKKRMDIFLLLIIYL